MNIVHRDLKLENLMLSDKTENARIKLIDFGLSKYYGNNELNTKKRSIVKMRSMVGTPAYLAPEVIYGEYDYRCDYWSIGIVIFTLLYGSPPFVSNTMESTLAKILNCKLEFNQSSFDSKVSEDAKDIMSKLICENPNKRLTYKQAIRHPWLKNISSKK